MLDPDITKLTIAVCICFYNDMKSLKRCLDSVAGNVEYVFALDGRFNYNTDDDYFAFPLSTDGSREIVNCYRDQNVFLIDKPDMTESQKREEYCQIAREYNVDAIIILDSDEYVYCADWPAFRHDCYQKMVVRDKGNWNIYNIPFREADRPRLWWHPWELAYGTTHYEFYKKNDPAKALINSGGDIYHLVEHIVISHKHNLRDAPHMHAHQRWELKQQAVEDNVRFGKDWRGLRSIKRADQKLD